MTHERSIVAGLVSLLAIGVIVYFWKHQPTPALPSNDPAVTLEDWVQQWGDRYLRGGAERDNLDGIVAKAESSGIRYDWERALSSCCHQIMENRTEARLWSDLCYITMKCDRTRWAVAAESAQMAIKCDPVLSVGHYNLGCALAEGKQVESAIKALTRAVELDPSLRAYLSRDTDLESLRTDPTFVQLQKG